MADILLNNQKIELATPKDSRKVWEIRNHPNIRNNSLDNSEIDWEDHNKWFNQKYFIQRSGFCFVLKLEGSVAGYIRFDYKENKDAYLVSIAIDPSHQGKGLGGILLRQSAKLMDPNKKIVAEILINNEISLKMFQKNNFTIIEQDDDKYLLEYRNL
jgi:spore coat polysaccharide biosynthesis protein SpsF